MQILDGFVRPVGDFGEDLLGRESWRGLLGGDGAAFDSRVHEHKKKGAPVELDR
jgi:hypothetical protein